MPNPLYSVGDAVILKNDFLSGRNEERICFIAAVLPETQRLVQYRVRFDGEKFERRVTEADIDRAAEPSYAPEDAVGSSPAPSSWIKTGAFKIKR
jgi:hypothetical protein